MQPNDWMPVALAAITAALIPAGVSLVRMRRDIDMLTVRMSATESEMRELIREIPELRKALGHMESRFGQELSEIKTHVMWLRGEQHGGNL